MLSVFHHIHHDNGEHKVHHCGGVHASIDPKLNYNIKHCACGKHSIDTQKAIGHAADEHLNLIELPIVFDEKCQHGGWHIESGNIEQQKYEK